MLSWLYIIARSRAARTLAALGAFLVWLGLTKRKARQDGAQAAEQAIRDKAAAKKEKANERMDGADLGIGASDADRVKRLHDFSGGGGGRAKRP
jgi:hypothetical protein